MAGSSPAKTILGYPFPPYCQISAYNAPPSRRTSGNCSDPGEIDVAIAFRLAALCAVVLVPVLLGLQRQLPEERARLADPVQDRRTGGRVAGNHGGWYLYRAVLSAVGLRRRTRRPV